MVYGFKKMWLGERNKLFRDWRKFCSILSFVAEG